MTYTTLTKSTVRTAIYKNFYTIISGISGFSGIVYPSYTDNRLYEKSEYPIVEIESVRPNWKHFTFGKNKLTGTITVNIFTTSPSERDSKADSVSSAVESAKHTLAGYRLKKVVLDSEEPDMFFHGNIKVYVTSQTYSFEYVFTKTSSGF